MHNPKTQAEIDAAMKVEASEMRLEDIFDHFVSHAPGCPATPCYPCARHRAYAERGREVIRLLAAGLSAAATADDQEAAITALGRR